MMSGEASPNSRDGDDVPVPDPARIETLPQLAEALNVLRRGRSYAALDRAAGGRPKAPTLPRSTLSDLMTGKSVPSKDTMVTFLGACGVTERQQGPWLASWERVVTGHLRRPAGAVRVRDGQPRLLGVHASIQVDPGAVGLPVYVPRDLDADLRAAVTAALDHGGFVLVKGGSSVGKTRSLFEAVRAVCPDWWLLHPADADAVRAFADAPAPRTVVWLDELQRYLTPPGVPAGAVRALLTAKLLVVATLWPGEYTARTALRAPGQHDPYAGDRELLNLAQVVDVPDSFSGRERQRAEELVADQRIRIALNTDDAGVTQVLAAGPELIRWWEHADLADARQCYGKAVITAALDARRVGATAPVDRDFLTAAAPAYLSSAQRATAPPDWLDQAVDYATTRLHGATACMTPVAARMGQIAGYETADYLFQHARAVRRAVPLDEVVWNALVQHHDPRDAVQLARSANFRGRLSQATAFARDAAASGDTAAARLLAELLFSQGGVDELRQRAETGDREAAERLDGLLAVQGRVEELLQRATAGDRTAAELLANMLALDGKVDEGATLLRRCIDDDDEVGIGSLATLLATYGRVDEAIAVLRPHAAAGNDYLAGQLAGLFAKNNRVEELRRLADGGDRYAGELLVQLLAGLGQLDELEQFADGGHPASVTLFATTLLMEARARQGRVDEAHALLLRTGGWHDAVVRLADVLAEQGHLDKAVTLMQSRATGDRYVAGRLAVLRGKHGQPEQAIAELRRLADDGDPFASAWLIELLAEQGRVVELEEEVAAGTPGAVKQLATLCSPGCGDSYQADHQVT